MVGSAVSLAEEIVSPVQTGQSEIDDENQISSSLAEDPFLEMEDESTVSSSQNSQMDKQNRRTELTSVYFPEKPTEKEISDANILPGQIPLAELEQRLDGEPSSYSYSKSLSSNNSQIVSQPLATIASNHQSQFPQFGYADGVGSPRGIMIGTTANSVTGEIDKMASEYQTSFVHGVVDADSIVEVHPTDYAVWASGINSNPYFIQIKLVESDNRVAFDQSVNNQAYYVATLLKKYKLTPSRATGALGNPQGTVWGKFEAASLLGGTSQIEPVDYF